jgi:hypothetical protein
MPIVTWSAVRQIDAAAVAPTRRKELEVENTMLWIVSGVVAVIGILGLFLAAGAADTGIYAFGLLLFAFAVLFVFSRIKNAFDAAEAGAFGEEGTA